MTKQQLIETVSTKSVEEAIAEVQAINNKLSPRAAKNVILDVQDAIDGKMSDKELEFRLAEAGL